MDNCLARARAYLSKLPPAISGSSGHGTTFHAACVLVQGFALDEANSLALMREYNKRCVPPWTEKELLHKVTDAARKPNPNRPRGYLLNQTRDGSAASLRYPAKRLLPPFVDGQGATAFTHLPPRPRGVEFTWKPALPAAASVAAQAAPAATRILPSRALENKLRLTPREWEMLSEAGMEREPMILAALEMFDAHPVAVTTPPSTSGTQTIGQVRVDPALQSIVRDTDE